MSMCNCSAWCMVARRVSKPNICRLRILHCLCQHGCEPEIFMFPRLSCVCIHLEMWAEVKVHPYHARAHVCVGSCMCFAQATPLSKLQWATVSVGTVIIPYIGVAYTRGGGVLPCPVSSTLHLFSRGSGFPLKVYVCAHARRGGVAQTVQGWMQPGYGAQFVDSSLRKFGCIYMQVHSTQVLLSNQMRKEP